MSIRQLTLFLFVAIVAAQTSYADDRQSIQVGDATRTFVVRAPETLQPSSRVPLVFVLHGGGGNAANAENMTGFTAKAKQENFIVVYPEGSGRLRRRLFTWNAGHCCGYAMENKVDDVAFINALIDDLSRRYSIDDKRIYVTGMSNGGMMTHRLGIELANRIAAIAPVVATVFGDEKIPAHPVSTLMINGMQDKNVPHEGGTPGGRGSDAWDGTPTKPALDQAAFWAQANGCTSVPQQDDTNVRVRYHYNCPSGRATELLLVKDNGHAWPGGEPGSRRGDTPSQLLNATDAIWAFFKAHPASR